MHKINISCSDQITVQQIFLACKPTVITNLRFTTVQFNSVAVLDKDKNCKKSTACYMPLTKQTVSDMCGEDLAANKLHISLMAWLGPLTEC